MNELTAMTSDLLMMTGGNYLQHWMKTAGFSQRILYLRQGTYLECPLSEVPLYLSLLRTAVYAEEQLSQRRLRGDSLTEETQYTILQVLLLYDGHTTGHMTGHMTLVPLHEMLVW